MYGDFSRWTHNTAKRYRRVLQQQGRVLTDADWNELNALLSEETRLLAADLIGSHGGPKNNCGFFVTMKPGELPDEHPNKAGFEQLIGTETDLYIGAGHYYVDGLLCDLSAPTTYRRQPHRSPVLDKNDTDFLEGRDPSYLLYLEVWERYLNENDEPLLRDPALTETCSRSQLVWQVRAVKFTSEGSTDGDGGETREESQARAEAFLKEQFRNTGSRPRLKAQVAPGSTVNDPCILPIEARYRGRENQLYRVEIHNGSGTGGPVTWKWSRDNGSTTFPILRLEGTAAVVGHLGQDSHSTLKVDDWVEVLDDGLILQNAPGPLAQVIAVDRDEFLVTLKFTDANIPDYAEKDAAIHPFLRRWDHKGTAAVLGGALAAADATGEKKVGKLEYGIEIQFASTESVYRTGDYWLIPARTATGGIQWPENQFLAAQGVERHYAPLALLKNEAATDLRSVFGPLAQLVP